jgi:predicted 2-oxoglutarate/Fe(II)-dependent dioxygenase YbiX
MPNANFFVRLGLFAIPGFLEPELCLSLRNEMSSSAVKQATVRLRDSEDDHAVDEREAAYGVNEKTRRTRSADVGASSASLVEERLLEVKDRLAEHFAVQLTGIQNLQFLIYRQGDFFRPHVDRTPDQVDDAGFVKERQVSAVIFLNGEATEHKADGFEGGALTFYGLFGEQARAWGLGLPLSAEPGLLIAFPPSVIHEVTPVVSGERCTVVTWFV